MSATTNAGQEMDQNAATFWRHARWICHPAVSEGSIDLKSYPQSHSRASGGLISPHVGQFIPSRITPCRPQLHRIRPALGDNQRNIVVLFVRTELPDLVDNRCKQFLGRLVPVTP